MQKFMQLLCILRLLFALSCNYLAISQISPEISIQVHDIYLHLRTHKYIINLELNNITRIEQDQTRKFRLMNHSVRELQLRIDVISHTDEKSDNLARTIVYQSHDGLSHQLIFITDRKLLQ